MHKRVKTISLGTQLGGLSHKGAQSPSAPKATHPTPTNSKLTSTAPELPKLRSQSRTQ